MRHFLVYVFFSLETIQVRHCSLSSSDCVCSFYAPTTLGGIYMLLFISLVVQMYLHNPKVVLCVTSKVEVLEL